MRIAHILKAWRLNVLSQLSLFKCPWISISGGKKKRSKKYVNVPHSRPCQLTTSHSQQSHEGDTAVSVDEDGDPSTITIDSGVGQWRLSSPPH